MRKLFYSSVAIAAATSLCYPNEAVALTSEAYDSAMASVKSLWPGEGQYMLFMYLSISAVFMKADKII